MSQQMERLMVKLEKPNYLSSRGSKGHETALFSNLWPGTTRPSLGDEVCSAGALLKLVPILKPKLKSAKTSRKSFPSLPLPHFLFTDSASR